MATQSVLDPWDVGGNPGRIECDPQRWDEIIEFAMAGFSRVPWGGPEIGALLFGRKMPGCVRIEAWRQIPCEHANGPSFELSERDEAGLRQLLAHSENDIALQGLERVGWFESRYCDFSLNPRGLDFYKAYFPEPWQIALVIHRARLGPRTAGFFFRKADGSLASEAREFTTTADPTQPAAILETNAQNFPEPPGAEPSIVSEVLAMAEPIIQAKAASIPAPEESPEAGPAAVESGSTHLQPPTEPKAQRSSIVPPVKTAEDPLADVSLPYSAPEHWASFGLSHDPFAVKSDPEFIYWSRQHQQALTDLLSSLENRKGIAMVTGEAGTGKSMIMAYLGDLLPERNIEFAFLLNSRVTVEQFYQMLDYEFALDTTHGGKSAVLFALGGLADKQTDRGRTTALLIDEAHHLPADVLKEIRFLDNLQIGTVKAIQIVLAGQPELESRLEAPELQSLKQRILLRCVLDPMSEVDTAECIAQRFGKAGLKHQYVFPPELLLEIHSYSQGVPRVMNTICDHLLRACATAKRKTASLEMLKEVGMQLELQSIRALDLSESLGKKTVATTGHSKSTGLSPTGQTEGESTTEGETGRNLLNPDEILNLGRDVAIVLNPLVWDDGYNYIKHERASARMEKEFGHEIVPGKHHKRDREKQPEFPRQELTADDAQQEKRTGIKTANRKAEISALYHAADSGPALKAALEEAGYLLAKGDRGYVVVDQTGGQSVLTRNTGLKKKELEAFMAGVPLATLPTVEEAKALQKSRPVEAPPPAVEARQPAVEPAKPGVEASKFVMPPDAPQPQPPAPRDEKLEALERAIAERQAEELRKHRDLHAHQLRQKEFELDRVVKDKLIDFDKLQDSSRQALKERQEEHRTGLQGFLDAMKLRLNPTLAAEQAQGRRAQTAQLEKRLELERRDYNALLIQTRQLEIENLKERQGQQLRDLSTKGGDERDRYMALT